MVTAVGAALVALPCRPSGAERPARPLYWGVGAGGYGALTGPAGSGLAARAEIYPGHWLGRLGLRGEVLTLGARDRLQGTLGLCYEAAAARPRLQAALFADAGVAGTGETLPVLGSGAELQGWLAGPLAVTAALSARLYLDGLDSQLALAATLMIGLARAGGHPEPP